VRSLTLATVLPSTIGDEAILAVKSIVPGTVRTSVHSVDGRHELVVLDERHVDGGPDGRQGLVTFTWNGTDATGARLPRGEYRVRFSLAGDGHRDVRIIIA
jgi:flagellar hook assembly protein FlgD